MESSENGPIALVIGLCSHGVAMTRALNKEGIEVHAFEANPNLPGTITRSANVHLVNNIKTDSLIADLQRFRANVPANRPIVLFPTNDNNVKVIANHINELTPAFLVSWGHCSADVLALLLKSNIERRCEEQGLLYPQSFVINHYDDVAIAEKEFEFPVIAKPVNPQSSFKALKCNTKEELRRLIVKYEADLPILVQHWITGTDVDLFFGALYLDKGKVLSRFVGNKLESHPPAMGQTTVAITSDNPEILPLTETFFNGLNMSGPVSLELKRDHLGRYWVIEPTVGRTDFWVGLCVDANCNLLYTEFLHSLEQPVAEDTTYRPTIWFDSERDVTAFARHLNRTLPWANTHYATSFSYLQRNDLRPFFRALKQASMKLAKSLVNRIDTKQREVLTQSNSEFTINIYQDLDALPQAFKTLLENNSKVNIFLGGSWYLNFCQQVANQEGEARFYCLTNEVSEAVAIFPMWMQRKRQFGMWLNYLTSLTNYYSPIFDVILDEHLISKSKAYNLLFSKLRATSNEWDFIHIFPADELAKKAILSSSEEYKLRTDSYVMTKNWYEKVENGYEQYIAGVPSKTKNTIKRKVKKLNRTTDWSINIYKDTEGVQGALAQYHEVYNNSWKPAEPYPHFVNGLAECAARKGWLRLGILKIDEVAVAAQLWLVENKTANIYKLAYRDEYRQYSPGTILTDHLVKSVIENDHVTLIDFLTGKDDFKKDWMTSSRDLFGIQITNYSHFKSIVYGLRNTLSNYRNAVQTRLGNQK